MSTRRRQFTAEFKAQRVLEMLSGRKTAAAISREYQLKPDLLTRWKTDFVAHAAEVFGSATISQHTDQRVAELERLVGRLTLELEITKKAARLSAGSSGSN
jgi:transposase-like protein